MVLFRAEVSHNFAPNFVIATQCPFFVIATPCLFRVGGVLTGFEHRVLNHHPGTIEGKGPNPACGRRAIAIAAPGQPYYERNQ